MKLGLGTAQFGGRYGIAGAEAPSHAEVERILRRAAEAGISVVDTAPAYGESESRIGVVLWRQHAFRIVTKTPALRTSNIGDSELLQIEAALDRSLANLKQESVYGLLVHSADDLLASGGERLMEALARMKKSGKVRKIGVSVYDGLQIDAILARFELDIVQLPLSLIDQRLLLSGHIADLQRRGIEIHARSVLLQGVLLLAPEHLPRFLGPLAPKIGAYRSCMKRSNVPLATGAIGFVTSCAGIACALVGVDGIEHFDQLLAAANAPLPADFETETYACSVRELVNPGLWPKLPDTSSSAS